MSTECLACRVEREGRSAALSFIAGIAFAASFNNEAMHAQLCNQHQEMLQRGFMGALPSVKPADARHRGTS